MAQAAAGLILAGGAGQRFGGPKADALLPGGETFLARCSATLIEAGVRTLAVTIPPGSRVVAAHGVKAIELPIPGLDMFASLRLGLETLVQDAAWQVVAVLPVDHPLVVAATVRSLAAVAAPAVVPVFRGKRGHPVCLSRNVATSILSGDLPGPTLRDVLHACGRHDLTVDDPGVVTNCNTPEALAAALGTAGLR